MPAIMPDSVGTCGAIAEIKKLGHKGTLHLHNPAAWSFVLGLDGRM